MATSIELENTAMPSPSEQPPVKSADRVLDVFELLADAGPGLTHTEIAAALGIPKGSLTKLVKTLVLRGYLSFNEQTKTHGLGPAIQQLAERPLRVRRLIELAGPVLQGLTRTTNESSALNRLYGQHTEVIATATSTQRLVSHLREGDLAPLHAVSGGKSILAHLPKDKLALYLRDTTLEALTPQTITTASDLSSELEKIRETGIAFSEQEYTPGIIGVAVSLDLPSGFPPCSINVAIPAARMTDALQAQAIKALHVAKQAIHSRLETTAHPDGQPGNDQGTSAT